MDEYAKSIVAKTYIIREYLWEFQKADSIFKSKIYRYIKQGDGLGFGLEQMAQEQKKWSENPRI